MRRGSRSSAALACGLALACGATLTRSLTTAHAQELDQTPDTSAASEPFATITVTATRTETRLDEATTTVTVIDRDDIEARHAENVMEVLREVPGVDISQSGSRGTNTEIFIRGADADQTLVMIDGVEVNSVTLGAFDFGALTTANVERIEVLRGSGGTLYGSQAVGGVVNVITRAGSGRPGVSVLGEAGNAWTGHGAVSSSGQVGKLRYSVAGAYFDTQGFHAENDDYRNGTASMRLDYDVLEHATARLFFRYTNSEVGLINSNNFLGGPDPNARQSDEFFLIKGEWEQELIPDLELRVAASYTQDDQEFDDPPDAVETSDTRSDIRSGIANGEVQLNHYWGQLATTTVGVEIEERLAKVRSDFVDPLFESHDRFDESRRNVAGYFQEQLRLLDGALLGVGGVRVDGNEEFGIEVSPSVSASYALPWGGLRLRAGYFEGFKAPTFNELFFPNFGNPDLDAETSREYNVGVVHTAWAGRAVSEVTFFDRRTDDLIEGRPQPDGLFRAENLGDVHVQGVEIAPRVLVCREPQVTFAATYTRLVRVGDTPPLLRRPKDRGGFVVNVAGRDLFRPHTRYDVNLKLLVVGDRIDVNPAHGFAFDDNPAYTKVDLAASYTFEAVLPARGDLTVFAKVENLLNEDYQEALGFDSPPTNFLAGVRVAF